MTASNEWKMLDFMTVCGPEGSNRYQAVIKLAGDLDRGSARKKIASEQAEQPLAEVVAQWQGSELVSKANRLHQQAQQSVAEAERLRAEVRGLRSQFAEALSQDQDTSQIEQRIVQGQSNLAQAAVAEERASALRQLAAEAGRAALADLRKRLNDEANRQAVLATTLYQDSLEGLRLAIIEHLDQTEVGAVINAWYTPRNRGQLIEQMVTNGEAALPIDIAALTHRSELANGVKYMFPEA